MRKFLFLVLAASLDLVYAQQEVPPYHPPSPEEVQVELNQAEADFQRAKEMFNPWYAGPLITGGYTNMTPGFANIQPYIYFTNTYAEFDKNRNSKNIKDIYTISPLYLFQTGITNWLDTSMTVSAVFNNQGSNWASNIGDTTWGFGIQLYRESPYIPGFRGTVTQTFPTGKYEKLDPKKEGIDATGGGAYTTTFGLNFGKVIWQLNPLHPFAVRFNINYTITAPTNVKEFNVFGGGFGTDGKIKPGNTFNTNFGIEYSITQKWVAALDVVYDYTNSSNFSGRKGVDVNGQEASLGAPSSSQLSFAPAIEYNPSSTFGYVGGVWFTGCGRNSSNFVSLVFTFYAVF
ncbi:MAG: hypothetical protein WDZ28_00520 [Simkaniaceae bacterium]